MCVGGGEKMRERGGGGVVYVQELGHRERYSKLVYVHFAFSSNEHESLHGDGHGKSFERGNAETVFQRERKELMCVGMEGILAGRERDR